MSKYGVDVTNMAEPSLGAASHIRSPVADESGLVMTELLGKAALQIPEAYKGYQMASYEKDIEAEIDTYMAPRQAEQEVGMWDKAEESIWNKVASDKDYQPDVKDFSAVQQGLDKATSKYKAALEQGVLTPEQFEARVLDATRRAVNRTPGLADELIGHGKRVLELSGMTSTLKSDIERAQTAEKSQADLLKRILDMGKDEKVPLYLTSGGNPDYGRIKAETEERLTEKRLVTAAENFGKLDTEGKKKTGREFMESGGITLMNGKLSELLSLNATTIAEEGDVQGAITLMRMRGEQAYQQYFQMLSPIVADSPAAKEALDYFRKQIDTSISFLEKSGTKEDALKRSNAITQILKNKNYQDVAKYTNPEQLDMTTKILSTVGAGRILEQNPQLMKEMVNTFGDLLGGVSGSPRINYDASIQGKNIVSQGLVELAKEAVADPKAVKYLEKTINTISTDVQNPERFKDTASKFSFYEKLVRDLGSQDLKKGLSKVGAPAISQATGMIDDYMKITTPDMMKSILAWEQKGVAVTLDALPDGRIIFKTGNQQATQDLNSRYTPRINESLAAMANLMNLDTKSVAVEHFFPAYLPAWADDPDLTPLKIQSESDADIALKTGEITKQEHAAIIKSGFKK